MNKELIILVLVSIILLSVAAIIFGPMLTIWALNTLFHLEISITWATWFATLILTGVFSSAATTAAIQSLNTKK